MALILIASWISFSPASRSPPLPQRINQTGRCKKVQPCSRRNPPFSSVHRPSCCPRHWFSIPHSKLDLSSDDSAGIFPYQECGSCPRSGGRVEIRHRGLFLALPFRNEHGCDCVIGLTPGSVDLARSYESHGCVREVSGGHIGVTEGDNESSEQKRAD
jgi:hypothetical protein